MSNLYDEEALEKLYMPMIFRHTEQGEQYIEIEKTFLYDFINSEIRRNVKEVLERIVIMNKYVRRGDPQITYCDIDEIDQIKQEIKKEYNL